MRRPWLLLSLIAACSGPAGTTTAPLAQHALAAFSPPAWANTVTANPGSVADVAEAAVRAVVHIQSARDVAGPQLPPGMWPGMQGFPGMNGMPAPGPRVERGVGSGVVIDAQKGLILTNHHVVAGAESLTVTLSDGRKLSARVLASDPPTDVAVVELVGEVPTDLTTLPFGDSDRLRLGDPVLAIGSPFALQGTVTMGIVSARGRHVDDLAAYSDYVQTDAAINPGNSGGALVDLSGNLVGINTAIASSSGGYDGIGFAIPANLARDILDRLLRDGRVVRGLLGVIPTDLDPDAARSLGLGERRGAILASVTDGSPAAGAGLKPYDVIVGVDGRPITGAAELRNTISLSGAHQDVTLAVLRDGQELSVKVKLDELKEGDRKRRGPPTVLGPGLLSGVDVVPLDERGRYQLGLDRAVAGAVVANVVPGSNAALAGLQPGDVIVEIDRQAVVDPEQVETALKGKTRAMLLVQRRDARQIVFLD